VRVSDFIAPWPETCSANWAALGQFLVAGLLLLTGAGLALLIRSEAPASASGIPGDATRSPATSLTGTHVATAGRHRGHP
jgi:hypothetical protein